MEKKHAFFSEFFVFQNSDDHSHPLLASIEKSLAIEYGMIDFNKARPHGLEKHMRFTWVLPEEKDDRKPCHNEYLF